MSQDIDTMVRGIAPVSDEEAAHLVSDRDALARAVLATTSRGARPAWRRMFRPLTLPIATAVTGAAVVATLAVVPDAGQPPGTPPSPSIQQAALSFTQKDGYLTVVIRDPYADPERYRKELAEHGLDIDLRMAPVTPSVVGQVIFLEGGSDEKGRDIELIDKPECTTYYGGTDPCSIGFRVPLDYADHYTIVIGRPARPGEEIEGGGPQDEGQPLHGIPFQNRKVSAVLADLKDERGITVTEFRYEHNGSDKPYQHGVPPDEVDPDWYVLDVVYGDGNELILFVGPDRY